MLFNNKVSKRLFVPLIIEVPFSNLNNFLYGEFEAPAAAEEEGEGRRAHHCKRTVHEIWLPLLSPPPPSFSELGPPPPPPPPPKDSHPPNCSWIEGEEEGPF